MVRVRTELCDLERVGTGCMIHDTMDVSLVRRANVQKSLFAPQVILSVNEQRQLASRAAGQTRTTYGMRPFADATFRRGCVFTHTY